LVCLFIYWSVCLSSIYWHACLSVCLSVSIYWSICLYLYLLVCLPVCLYILVCFSLSKCLSACLSLFIGLSACLSLCIGLSIFICLSVSTFPSVRPSSFQVHIAYLIPVAHITAEKCLGLTCSCLQQVMTYLLKMTH